jgi:hypothetical protein
MSAYDDLAKLDLPTAYDKGLAKTKVDLACWEEQLTLSDAELLARRDAAFVAEHRQIARNNIASIITYYEGEAKIFAYIKEHGSEDG